MELDPTTADAYSFLTGIVTPRPIAWITTISPSGVVNLAPYSFFNVFGEKPAIIVFSPNLKLDGSKKDTHRNIEANGEFVINASVTALAEAVNITSKGLQYDESELSLTPLTTVPSRMVKPPRIAESPAHLECRLREIQSFGTHGGAPNLVIAEVVLIHIEDSVLTNGLPDPRKLQTIGRMGNTFWTRTTDGLFEQERPT
jgi:flavin reductase (DIM6/NTAB) family NADH-FMN oxidoreductase RutF